ncbi:Rv1733c family protein [Nocardia gamkensis]|uniref:Rv1733c family protein n=1 Tax=Nocardia gamkensis TaxID=352869 RepID=UPI0037C79FBA
MQIDPCSPNPLMRGTDRLESAVRILAILTCLVAIPVAAAAGHEDYTVAAERIRIDSATKVAVTATITLEPSRTRRISIAEVGWMHDGIPGSATVVVPGASVRGDSISIWLGADATATTPPVKPARAVMLGIGAATVVLIQFWVTALMLVIATRWCVTRYQRQLWERHWENLDADAT